ncbi:hypothetical protein PoB_006816900 [Plakobranchus ocellatus]|uniref:Uncharacterized protein n=1 Tax=Plakobranchus ocellatus TaxID=259542 RepID=A0AAV4DBS5_9GAST|nr:hypothetical protein PoB_006816900 [Plakobranchus ocellatus]
MRGPHPQPGWKLRKNIQSLRLETGRICAEEHRYNKTSNHGHRGYCWPLACFGPGSLFLRSGRDLGLSALQHARASKWGPEPATKRLHHREGRCVSRAPHAVGVCNYLGVKETLEGSIIFTQASSNASQETMSKGGKEKATQWFSICCTPLGSSELRACVHPLFDVVCVEQRVSGFVSPPVLGVNTRPSDPQSECFPETPQVTVRGGAVPV